MGIQEGAGLYKTFCKTDVGTGVSPAIGKGDSQRKSDCERIISEGVEPKQGLE
jgi:hypothetical protein